MRQYEKNVDQVHHPPQVRPHGPGFHHVVIVNSTIDLERNAQPLCSDELTVVVVVPSEIWDTGAADATRI